MGAVHSSGPSRTRRLLSNLVLVAVLALAGLGAAAVISGQYQIRPVLSGSMRPGLAVGGVVVTERVPIAALQVRDVVVFHRPDKPEELMVHRIIALTPGASGPVVQTQGDANTIPDPWTVTLRGTTAYRAVFSVPLIGYVAVWAHGPTGSRILMGLGLALIAAAVLGGVRQRRRSTGRAPDSGSSATATLDDGATLDGGADRDDREPVSGTEVRLV
ncbi:MAG TPA: signal peptidase I [Cellulomonadaceae bacterium]|nr:signal peptidase I [Cellulomonadaceae bacterium]